MKRLIALLIACVMLTGCQLATDEVNEDGLVNQDQLVGVVVTMEHLDLFDIEAFLKDNPQALRGGEINPVGSEYQNRIYAQEVVENTTTEDGVSATTTYYNFDHVDGMYLLDYQAKTYLEDGSLLADMTVGDCSEGILSVAYLGDRMEGTIYVPRGSGEVCFFTNPVYQDAEGRLYLVAGTGTSNNDLSGSMWQTITEEYTETIDGEVTTRKREVEIRMESVEVPTKVAIIQMSGENILLDRQEFTPEDLPETLTPVDGCAYILVEEYVGGELKRTMVEPDESYISVFVKTDNIYCTAVGTEILWQEK